MTDPAPLPLAEDPRLPLHARLRDALARRLAAGEWPPGTALPAESRLAQDYGVALQTMRRALSHLEQEGLVERRQGRGTFSRQAPAAASLLRFFLLRHAGEAKGPILPESRILSARQEGLPPEAAARLGRPAGAPALRLERLRAWGGETLLAETIHLPLPEAAPLLALPPEGYGALLYPLLQARCGLLVARVEDEVSVGRADAATALALGLQAGEAVILADRTAFDAAGRAVEHRIARGRADRFRYRATAT
ncbi:GntR family transcriptional regulator [Roseomonas sp. GC11]|uniref:GntR family transcriptional regulator n=1 Tax=Roseomonas sp. GC11 TaxID=2950546 RepID=UPI00210EC1DC|nr:GntR family transcriptional regulator [Roseomonas sp. GC11]MCQ4159014.1 GntR family transcriptional regulator [Roseomonas sp. GC11]